MLVFAARLPIMWPVRLVFNGPLFCLAFVIWVSGGMILLRLLAIECLFSFHIFALGSFPVGRLETGVYTVYPFSCLCAHKVPQSQGLILSCVSLHAHSKL